MVSYQQRSPLKILIANAKGGSGKTTVATNLAAYYASLGESVVLYDKDPQSSSHQWLKQRPEDISTIKGINACTPHTLNQTRSWQLRLPEDCDKMIIDSPAAISEPELRPLIRQADLILVPVLPSSIDIHAAATFIKTIMLTPEHLQQPGRICVIANRVRRNTLSHEKLKLFLNALSIPYLSTLRDTQNYVAAAELGLGVHEIRRRHTQADLTDWSPIISWIDSLQIQKVQAS